MKNFEYSARSKDGSVQRGDVEAKSRTQVVEMLQQKGLVVVKVQEKIAVMEMFKQINIGGVPIDDKVIFMRQFSTMISAGLPMAQALEILAVQATNPLFKKVLDEVLAEVESGTSLTKAFKNQPGVFDDIVLNLIKAGEDSGKLEEICKRLADELEHRRDFQNKIKSAMIYPIIISVVIVIVVTLVMLFMIPAVSEMYSEFGGELPMLTQILVAISDFMVRFWWLCLLVLVGIAAGIKYYLSTETGKKVFDNLKLKFPVFGDLNVKIQLAQFTQTLTLLVSSGIAILDALDLVADSLNNYWFEQAVKTIAREVEKGSSLALPMSREERFPLIVSQMVGVGEETGELDGVLKKMAEYYVDEVNRMTDNLATMMEPFMLVIMGVVIGFIAVAVYLPMFSLANVLG
ncbi:MAG: type II secretion system F family protein [Patescibacteria group bacterium]|nr:type II secretion system F family protein [Patescibacteria group bacterium]